MAYFVHEEGQLTLTDLGKFLKRDPAALSRAAGRLRERVKEIPELADKINSSRKQLLRISRCQA